MGLVITAGSDILQNLKRIEVIGDEESEIIEAVQRMSNNYDFVVTSGGIGPTYIFKGMRTYSFTDTEDLVTMTLPTNP